MKNESCVCLGNKDLLEKTKVGLLVSRKISTPTVLPTLDWAVKSSKDKNLTVISGFQSKLEKDVLKFLLKGRCGIIMVLARGMYKQLPEHLRDAMNDGRLLIISLEKESLTRVSVASAMKRNKYIVDLADEMTFVGVTEESNLFELMSNYKNKRI